MDYFKIYDNLIDRGRKRILTEYKEIHHIKPRCLGGPDDTLNLVELTPEEHLIAHLLLVKMYPGNNKLVYAANLMRGRFGNNKKYGWLRRAVASSFSEDFKQKQKPLEGDQSGSSKNDGSSCSEIS